MLTISDKYLILEKLGNQVNRKFGSVFLAKNILTGEQVIIKTNSGKNDDSIETIQLRKEQHFSFEFFGLPKVIDFYEVGKELFLIKKFQKGIPLDEYWSTLNRKERIPFLMDMLAKLNEILSYLHEQQIFHCDLKPSNILIDSKQDGFNIEIIDFGLAIQQPINENRKLLFPLGYAAPELILNQLQEINVTSDFFAIGVIIWRLFNGNLPLMHSNPSIYTNLQLTHPLEDSSKLPKGIHTIVSKMTVKPAFRTSPNRMKQENLIIDIRNAQKLRYSSLDEVINDFKLIKPRKFLGLI